MEFWIFSASSSWGDFINFINFINVINFINFIRFSMEVDSRPSPSHFQILVLFGYKTGLFGMVDIKPLLPCWVSTSSKRRWLWSAVTSPRLRLVLFTMIGSKTSRGVRATNHSTRIRTSQLVYYCICHIYMNLWWVNGFSYLKESQFYSSWNLGSVFRGFSIFPDVTTVLPIMAWDQAKNSQVVTSGRWAWSGSWFSHGKIAKDLVILPKWCEVW